MRFIRTATTEHAIIGWSSPDYLTGFTANLNRVVLHKVSTIK